MNCIINYILICIIILIVIIALNKKWWNCDGLELFGHPSYSENFEDHKPDVFGDSPILEFPPNTPGPSDLYNNQPYHLLADELPSHQNEILSCVNSRSCYATDFERMVSKTGNYSQMTNNYKRGYPDSCSSPYQELVMNFYKADPMYIS